MAEAAKTKRRRFVPSLGELVILAVALFIGAIVALSIHDALQPDPWNPLGPYPVQTIKSQGPRVKDGAREDSNATVPQIKLGSDVAVAGEKCVAEDLTVLGEYGWRSIVPSGFSYQAPKGAPGFRLKGCAKLNFQNEIPAEVDTWARKQIAEGRTPEVYIGGCEIPVKKDGTKGVEKCWRTEPFVLVLP